MSIVKAILRHLCKWSKRLAITIYILILSKTVASANGQGVYAYITLRHNLIQGYKQKVMPCVVVLLKSFVASVGVVWLGVKVDGSGGGCEQYKK